MTKHLLKKSNLTELLTRFTDRMELLEGLTSLQAVRQRHECQTIIRLLENEITLKSRPQPEQKKHYLQLYYLKNRDKLNKCYKVQIKEIRKKGKLYDKLKLTEKNI